MKTKKPRSRLRRSLLAILLGVVIGWQGCSYLLPEEEEWSVELCVEQFPRQANALLAFEYCYCLDRVLDQYPDAPVEAVSAFCWNAARSI